MVAARRDDDAGDDLEWSVEPLEFGRGVDFEMVSLLRDEVDRSHEHAPCFGLSVEIGHDLRGELEEELAHPGERASRRARLVGEIAAVLACSGPGQESEGRIQRVPELLEGALREPEIVGILNLHAPAAAFARAHVSETAGSPQSEPEVLVALEARRLPHRVETGERVARTAVGIAVG